MSQATERTTLTCCCESGSWVRHGSRRRARPSRRPCRTSPRLQEFQTTTLVVSTRVLGKEEGKGGSDGPSTQLEAANRRTGRRAPRTRTSRPSPPPHISSSSTATAGPTSGGGADACSLGGPAELIGQRRGSLAPPDCKRAAQPPPARRAEEATSAPSSGQAELFFLQRDHGRKTMLSRM
jgi:hypothetical protein